MKCILVSQRMMKCWIVAVAIGVTACDRCASAVPVQNIVDGLQEISLGSTVPVGDKPNMNREGEGVTFPKLTDMYDPMYETMAFEFPKLVAPQYLASPLEHFARHPATPVVDAILDDFDWKFLEEEEEPPAGKKLPTEDKLEEQQQQQHRQQHRQQQRKDWARRTVTQRMQHPRERNDDDDSDGEEVQSRLVVSSQHEPKRRATRLDREQLKLKQRQREYADLDDWINGYQNAWWTTPGF